jgi:hypothetical protein
VVILIYGKCAAASSATRLGAGTGLTDTHDGTVAAPVAVREPCGADVPGGAVGELDDTDLGYVIPG